MTDREFTRMHNDYLDPEDWISEIGERYGDSSDCVVIYNQEGSIAEMQCPKDVEQQYAEMICAAVNTCRSLNPADPLAAANALPGVVAALEAMMLVYEELHALYDLGDCDATVQARQALAALKGASQ